MDNKRKKENGIKVGLITTLLYLIIMGLGMFFMNRIFHYSYNNTNMVKVIFFVELVLTGLLILVTKKYYGFKKIGFKRLRITQLKWFIPSMILISIMTFSYGKALICSFGTLDKSKLILLFIIAITTFLVGFSEEVMFRGILLHSFANKKKLYLGLFISSILFALIHSVNILGGMPFEEMITQVVSSFLLGFFFAPLAIKLKSLIPLIIFHWLWDCILISSTVIPIEIGILPVFQMIFNVLLGVILWISVRKDKVV